MHADPTQWIDIPSVTQELLIRAKLPGLQRASQAQLNVTVKQLIVSVPSKYYLHLNLPYNVASEEGRASFNAAKQQLEVVLPVVPPPTPVPAPSVLPLEAQMQLQHQQSDYQCDMASSSSSGATAQQPPVDLTASSSNLVSSSADAALQSKHRADLTDQSAAGRQHQVDVTAGSSEQHSKQMPELTENQRRWQEVHRPSPIVSTAGVQPATSTAAEAETINADALQQAAASGHLLHMHGLPTYHVEDACRIVN